MRRRLIRFFDSQSQLSAASTEAQTLIPLTLLAIGLSIFSLFQLYSILVLEAFQAPLLSQADETLPMSKSVDSLAQTIGLKASQQIHIASSEAVVRLEPLDLNQASVEELMQKLSGLPAKKAEAIVAHRQLYGSFLTLEELLEVEGIGPGFLKKYRAQLSLTPLPCSEPST